MSILSWRNGAPREGAETGGSSHRRPDEAQWPASPRNGTLAPASASVDDWLRIAEACRAESRRDSERLQLATRELLSSDVAAIALWNIDGRVLDANDAFLNLLGYERSELEAGLTLSDLRLREHQEADALRLRELRTGGETTRTRELQLVRKDGSLVWCLALGELFQDGSGDGIVLLLNISQRKDADEQLRVLQDALEATANAVVITDLSGTIQWVNAAFSVITGYAPEEAVGRSTRLLRSGLMKPPFYEELWSTILSGQVWRGEIVNRRRDGTLYVEEQSITPVKRDGSITHFVAIKQDISERRRTEAALHESEQRFRDLFEQSLDAILVTDPELRIIDANPSCERLLGWSRDELSGQSALVMAIDPRARERFFQAIRERGVVRDFEVSGRTREGNPVEVQLNAVPRWDDRGRLLGYQAIARDVTARKRFEEELQHLAFHDWLTGLPNLALFRDRLEHAVSQADRTGSKLAIIYLDLDRFKTINDGHGHNAGDRAIQQVARRLLACFREEDTVARIGGDEFTVIIERLSGPAQLTHILERVTAALRTPLQVDGHRLEIEASVGAAIYQGVPDAERPAGRSAEDLVRKGDAAMYQAKRRPGTRYHIFDPAVDQDGSARIRQQQELRRAIEEDQLSTEYQPVVDIRSGTLWGVEVLARWRHPERGMVSPAEFIPLAEEYGLIAQLGEWILDRACRDLAGWLAAGLAQDTRLLVNISARQLEDREFPARLTLLLEKHDVDPSRLHLEVTETVAVQHPGRLQALRQLGTSVSVDDFGTGYSSLRYLRDLDVDSLKIEMGFTQGMANDAKLAAIVRTVVALGRDLRLDVIAEGIETETQLRMLQEMGCPLGQGYHYSRPIDASSLADLLREEAATPASTPPLAIPESTT